MTKDEALLRFFQSLRIAFKNATMYNMNHPAFVHCVEDLKGRAEDAFTLISPLSVGFTPRSLFADGRFWEGEKTFRELGMLFHLRKIKTLEIRPGVTLDELMRFSTKATLPLAEFVKLGGAGEIRPTLLAPKARRRDQSLPQASGQRRDRRLLAPADPLR